VKEHLATGEHHGDRDEQFVHRLESFSDIVIGFSLAELSLSLIVPGQVADLVHNPIWLIAYGWTFAMICVTWGSLTRIFRNYFTGSKLQVFLNYLLLASVGLFVYFVQVFIHAVRVGDSPGIILSYQLYFVAYGLSVAVQAALCGLGYRARRHVLAEPLADRALVSTWTFGTVAAVTFVALVITQIIGGLAPTWIWIGIPVGFGFGPRLGRVAVARSKRAQTAGVTSEQHRLEI
jgi:uncharacterized membrane protein